MSYDTYIDFFEATGRLMRHHCSLICVLFLFAGCGSDTSLFVDVTSELGVDFTHAPGGHDQKYFMPLCVGSGGAFFDFDNDGSLDILLLQNSGPDSQNSNRLYRQDGGSFHDVTENCGLDVSGFTMGASAGDINNDGKVDVLITEYGRARLFMNQSSAGSPKFVDVSEIAQIENDGWGTSSCFIDYDRDGWLDIVLVNYVSYDPSRWCADAGGRQDYCGPDAFVGRPTRLFRNLGDDDNDGIGDSRFEDVTISSGLSARPGPGLGVFCADFDGDRWPDIFIANDGAPNHLWINKQDGTFAEEAVTRGLGFNSMGKSEADMGIAIGDVDGNGLFDVFVTHLTTETHTLWRQEPRGVFTDSTATSGLTATQWRGTGFGTAMNDVDNDGDLDLILVNGRVTRLLEPVSNLSPSLNEFWSEYGERDQILLNDGNGKFVDASLENAALSKYATISRGLACGDFNNDGSIDLLVTRIGEAPSLYQNRNEALGNWLLVSAKDPKLNRDAYGAEIYVIAGEKQFMRWINPGYSYLCSNDPRAHFGLGKISKVDQIRVIWPDGISEEFEGTDANRHVRIIKGQGNPVDL